MEKKQGKDHYSSIYELGSKTTRKLTTRTDALFWPLLFILISKFVFHQNTFHLHLHSESNISRALPWHSGTLPVKVVLSLRLRHSGLMLCPQTAYPWMWISVLGRESSHTRLGLMRKRDGLALWNSPAWALWTDALSWCSRKELSTNFWGLFPDLLSQPL